MSAFAQSLYKNVLFFAFSNLAYLFCLKPDLTRGFEAAVEYSLAA